jgi:predicted nucleic acid-binding protein
MALAEELDATLITSDKKQAEGAKLVVATELLP